MDSVGVIGIIAARGGSKGIPKKNIKPLGGVALIEWTVRAAIACETINDVIVSSDDDHILGHAARLGALAHRRPDELATDISEVESAVIDVLKNSDTGATARIVVLIQATSPFTRSQDLSAALDKFEQENYDSMLSVVSSHSFLWNDSDEGARPINYVPHKRPRRQDMLSQFRENGCFYITRREIWDDENCRLGGRIGLFPMEEWQSTEIDSMEDWRQVEATVHARGLSPEIIET